MLVVVLNCCVIDTNDTPRRSKTSTSLAKSESARVKVLMNGAATE